MDLNEYLKLNGVVKISNILDTTYQNLEIVIGKKVWICDYRLNSNCDAKPIRAVKPTFVELTSNDELPPNKRVYYSPIHFREIKNNKTTSKIIAPYDNTGYKSFTGVCLNIFENKNDCIEFYKKQLGIAKEQYKNKYNSIKNMIDTKINEIDSLCNEFE